MKTVVLVTLFGSIVSTIACAGDAASGTALLDTCSGHYLCVTDDGLSSDVLLHKNGDVCMENSNIVLNADGTTNLVGWTWSGNASVFQECVDSYDQLGNPIPSCQTCTPLKASADAGSTGGKCTGSTYGCEQQSPPYCSAVSGCYMATRIGPNNSFDNYCTGYADSCDEMSTASSCTKQGCTWKP